MSHKAILLTSLLLISSTVMAEQSLLEGVAKQTAKNTAAMVAPGAMERAEAANQALKDAKQMKDTVKDVPESVKNQATETLKVTAKQKLEEATPEQLKQGANTVKRGAETAKQVKAQAKNLPESSKQAVKQMKHKAKKKAAEKTAETALELLQ